LWDILEVPDPDKYFRSGVLLVSSWYAIRDDVEAQCRLIQSAHRVGAAGFALKVGRYLGQVAEKVLDLANQLQIPVINIIKDVPYIEITHPLLTKILHDQAFRLEYHLKVHRLFRRVALEGGGFEAIVRTLWSLIHKPVAICNAEGRVLTWLPKETDQWPSLEVDMVVLDEMDIQHLAHVDHYDHRDLSHGIGDLIVFPVRIEAGIYGYFLIKEVNGPCSELNLIALENASTVAALEATKRAAIAEVEHHLRNDFVYDLISGNLVSEEVAQMRAVSLSWNFIAPAVVIIADIDGFGAMVESKLNETYAMTVKSKMLAAIQRTITSFSQSFMVVGRSDSCIAIVNLPSLKHCKNKKSKQLDSLLKDIQGTLRKELDEVTVSIAVSDPLYSLIDISSGYKQACELMKIGRKIFGPGQLATKDKLEIYRLFYRCEPKEELFAFCEKMLGALIKYDNKRGADLVHTLRCYLEKGASIRMAARSLFIHENTLRYRLRIIEKITGLNLRKASDRFHLAMALHISPFCENK
jgi:purine catabolism regulator